jgi:heterodisulfide reductase subunit A-like polyferredoxin
VAGWFERAAKGRSFFTNLKQQTGVLMASAQRKAKGDKIGAVMVIGGGIAGMQSALDLANSGYYVYLIEKSPSIGGGMSQLDKTFPTNDCAM